MSIAAEAWIRTASASALRGCGTRYRERDAGAAARPHFQRVAVTHHQAERGIADRTGEEHAVSGRLRTPYHRPFQERCQTLQRKPRWLALTRCDRIATEQRTAERSALAQALRKTLSHCSPISWGRVRAPTGNQAVAPSRRGPMSSRAMPCQPPYQRHPGGKMHAGDSIGL
jgi:hypothetical protein